MLGNVLYFAAVICFKCLEGERE